MKARILVVDSDPDYRNQLIFTLEWSGHAVVAVPTGKDAIACLRKEPFDVVITDVFMPEMDGLELIRALRKQTPDQRIIALSDNGRYRGHAYLHSAATAFGAAGVVDKSATFPELNRVITEVLG